MKLLALPVPAVGWLVPSADGWYTLALVGLLAGVEAYGRTTVTDLQDVLAVVVLAGAAGATVARHRRRPLPWAAWGLRRLARVARWLGLGTSAHGLDFRGDPPFPRRLPAAAWWAAGGLAGWGVLAAGAWAAAPDGWRSAAAHTVYLPYLAGLAVVWAGLLAGVAVGVLVPWWVFRGWLRAFPGDPDRRTAEYLLVGAYLASALGLAVSVPVGPVVGLVAAVLAGAAAAGARPGPPGPAFVWRGGPAGRVYAVPLWRVVVGTGGLLAGVALDLLLTARGGSLFGGPPIPDDFQLTAFVGTGVAWLFPGTVALLGVKLAAVRRTDPARQTPPTVHLAGADPAAVRAAAVVVAEWGWRVRAGRAARPGDVAAEVVAPERSEATEFEPRWPLKAAVDDLSSGRVKDRLARRDEVQLRRRVVRGLDALFKRSRPDRGPRGGGYWLAPHWWFEPFLRRQDGGRGRGGRDPDPRLVGPAYAEVFGPRPRQHLYRVLRAVRVDAVFVEDGVSAKSLERVVRAVFEVYDVHAGKRRVEDQHFLGVPKVRVMVHDIGPGAARRGDGYPEPKFDEVSRARVLHVFKDRGDHEERIDAPFDESWEPAPALGAGW